MPLASHADLLAVVDPFRNVDVERALDDDPPVTATSSARMFENLADAFAVRACPLLDELAEDVLRDAPHDARARAGATRAGPRVRLGTGRIAAIARHRDIERHRDAQPGERVHQVDLGHCLQVAPALRGALPPAPGSAQEVVTEERGEHVREVPEVGVHRLEPTVLQACLPEAVVCRSTLGVREHLVRLDDLLKRASASGAGDVGMKLARSAETTFDVGVVRVARDAERS
jgi:hypothetical protein